MRVSEKDHENWKKKKRDWTLSLNDVSAGSPIVRDGRWRRNTLEKQESGFPRLKTCRQLASALLMWLFLSLFMGFILWVIEDLRGTSHSL